jgi:hypothetical protein
MPSLFGTYLMFEHAPLTEEGGWMLALEGRRDNNSCGSSSRRDLNSSLSSENVNSSMRIVTVCPSRADSTAYP